MQIIQFALSLCPATVSDRRLMDPLTAIWFTLGRVSEAAHWVVFVARVAIAQISVHLFGNNRATI